MYYTSAKGELHFLINMKVIIIIRYLQISLES